MKIKKWASISILALATMVLFPGGSVASTVETEKIVPDSEQIIDPNSPNLPGYVLTASDEFNGGEINSHLFTDQYLPHWSTSPGTKAKYSVENGILKLRIDKDQLPWDPDHDSQTKVSSIQTYQRDYIHRWTRYADKAQTTAPFRGHIQKYGYFEIRAKAAPGGGVHSAWWMTGVNHDQPEGKNTQAKQSGEVDIFEILGRSHGTKARMTIHPWGDFPHLFSSTGLFGDGTTDYTSTWHVYGFEWLPDRMNLYLDGKLVDTRRQSPQYPMMTYLGVYEKPQAISWTGPFDPSVPYPKTFEIDYFRAYQKVSADFPQSYQVSDGYVRGETISQSGVVRWLGGKAGNDVTMTQVYAPQGGEYRLGIEYRNEGQRDLYITVNEKEKVKLAGLGTNSFSGKFALKYFTANLKPGWNTFTFSNPDAYAPDLGKMINYGPTAELANKLITADNAVSYGGAVIDKGAIRWLGKGSGNYAEFPNVYAKRSGWHKIKLLYRSGERRNLYVTANDRKSVLLRDLYSGSFSGKSSEVTLYLYFNQGWNTIRLGNPERYAPDIEAIQVIE